MVMEGQRLLFLFKKDGNDHIISSLSEVGRARKSLLFEVERVGQINQSFNGQFDNDCGNEFYIEQDIMKELDLEYVVKMKRNGYIVKMVTRRKAELVKNINLRGLNTHGCKISKIRTRKQMEDEGAHKPKDRVSL